MKENYRDPVQFLVFLTLHGNLNIDSARQILVCKLVHTFAFKNQKVSQHIGKGRTFHYVVYYMCQTAVFQHGYKRMFLCLRKIGRASCRERV